MAETLSTYRVVWSSLNTIISEGDVIKVGADHLVLIPRRGKASMEVPISEAGSQEIGVRHFEILRSVDGVKFDLAVHSTDYGKSFIYARRKHPSRMGGTGVWMAEDEGGTRRGKSEKSKKE